MNKVPCLFVRTINAKGRVESIGPEVTPGCEWVLAGEGIATRKFDGTACAVIGGRLYKRYDAKGKGEWRPPGFIACQGLEDSGSKPGWIPVGEGPEDRWHRETFAGVGPLPDGTYELCGPKVGGNPEGFGRHVLLRHGSVVAEGYPRDLDGLREAMRDMPWEGLVWHHPDGRMAKLRRHDFGFAKKGGGR